MASILFPHLVEAGGRTYRSLSNLQRLQPPDAGEEPSTSYADKDESLDSNEEQYSVQQRRDEFTIDLRLENAVLGLVIGTKGATKAKIERETGSRIFINSTSRDPAAMSEVLIRAHSRQAVVSAADRINLVLDWAMNGQRLDYNYFVSVPIAAPTVQLQLAAFKQQVLSSREAAAAGIEGSLFTDERKLHLTIAMLKLYTEARRQKAVQVLHSLGSVLQPMLGDEQLRIRLKGLQYMNDDPGAIHVLYLGVEDDTDSNGLGALKAICAAVLKAFDAEGLLLPRDNREVKLHATVMNTRHRSSPNQAPGAFKGRLTHQEERRPFDGRLLLKDWEAADFGEQKIDCLELSQRHKIDESTGYYHALAKLLL